MAKSPKLPIIVSARTYLDALIVLSELWPYRRPSFAREGPKAGQACVILESSDRALYLEADAPGGFRWEAWIRDAPIEARTRGEVWASGSVQRRGADLVAIRELIGELRGM